MTITAILPDIFYGFGIAGILIGLIRYVPRIVRKLDAIDELTAAQLKANGGGSLVDKVNKLVVLSANVDAIRDQLGRNHEEAKRQWQTLHDKDDGIDERLRAIEALARDFQQTLPPHVAVLDTAVRRLDSIERRIDRIEEHVFPPSKP